MTWTLLTNDDGIHSPALAPFARTLGETRGVRVCVPDRERSWVGKAMTRFDDIRVEPVEPLSGTHATWTCDGTPADAANVGVHGLAADLPSLVVSGINVGGNAGTAYLLSSGTVGAAFEGWASGVRAVAFSATSGSAAWGPWVRHATSPEGAAGWDRLAVLCASILDDLLATPILDLADVVSVNLPWEADFDTPRRLTTVARTGYGSLFPDNGGTTRRFTFDGTLARRDDDLQSDVDVVARGEISITPLRAPTAVPVMAEVRDAIESRRG